MPDVRIRKKANTDLFVLLEQRWKKLKKDCKRSHRNLSADPIHDLRISVRRFLSVLDVYAYVNGTIHSRKCRKWLKQILRSSRRLRDLHVERSSIAELLAANPYLKQFEVSLSERESKEILKLKKYWRKSHKVPPAASTLKKEIGKIIQSQPRLKLRTAVVRAVDHYHGRVMRRIDGVDPLDRASIHRVRVALKQFRYIAEVAQPLVGKRLEADILNQISAVQSGMGKIQDLEVLLADLDRWIRKNPNQKASALSAKLGGDRRQAVADFMSTRDTIAGFWKQSGPK